MERLPLIDPVVGDEELDEIRRVVESGYLTQGDVTEEFERSFAEFVGASRAVATTSCTTGLQLALQAFGVGDGDEVVLPAFTHPATAVAVEHVGATPVLVDVDRETYNVDPDEVRKAVTADTAALLPVSWGGQPLIPGPLHEIATDHGIPIIEDAACSAGAAYDDEPVGTQFDASVFSFHPRKVLTTGEGGMVVTDSPEMEEQMRKIKNFGTNPNDASEGFVVRDATNYRLSDVLAAIGIAQLEKASEILERRQSLANSYTDLLNDVDGICPPYKPPLARHTYQTYAVYVEAGDESTRDELIEALSERGIETQVGTFAVHETEAFADARRVGDLGVSSRLSTNLLTLPLFHDMTLADQQRVVDELQAQLDELS